MRISSRALDELTLGEQTDDPVERAGQRVGGGGDLLLQLRVVAFDTQVALGLADQVLEAGAVVGGMPTQLRPHRRQLRVVKCAILAAATTRGRYSQPGGG